MKITHIKSVDIMLLEWYEFEVTDWITFIAATSSERFIFCYVIYFI